MGQIIPVSYSGSIRDNYSVNRGRGILKPHYRSSLSPLANEIKFISFLNKNIDKLESVGVDLSGTSWKDQGPVWLSNYVLFERNGKAHVLPYMYWASHVYNGFTRTLLENFRKNGILHMPDEEIKDEVGKAYIRNRKNDSVLPKLVPGIEWAYNGLMKRFGKGFFVSTDILNGVAFDDLKKTELLDYPSRIYAGTGSKKNDMLDMADHLGIHPSSMLYIGDMSTDVKRARDAGVHSIGVHGYGYQHPQKLIDEKPVGGIHFSVPVIWKHIKEVADARNRSRVYFIGIDFTFKDNGKQNP